MLQASRVDFGENPFGGGAEPATKSLTNTEGMEIARTDMRAGDGEGPNWPAIASAGTDRLALAWIQPKGDKREVLRMQRLRVCFPKN